MIFSVYIHEISSFFIKFSCSKQNSFILNNFNSYKWLKTVKFNNCVKLSFNESTQKLHFVYFYIILKVQLGEYIIYINSLIFFIVPFSNSIISSQIFFNSS